tara:strand:- start:1733 stop:1933 length:201 start_codon:yes stop_codon:yes gene_type:complete
MTEMERDIYKRACVHYKKKKSIGDYGFGDDRPTIIGEFWADYFSGKPIYIEEDSPHEQRRLLGLHG